MIDYYWAIKNWTELNPCILLTDGTTIEEFNRAVSQKYENIEILDVIYSPNPKIVYAKNILITDGNPLHPNAELLVNNIFLFRCSNKSFSFFKNKSTFLLQDNEVYNDYPLEVTVVNYKKKILFEKYKKFNTTVTDTAMFYLTNLCRAISQEELDISIKKYGFKNNIILTDDSTLYNMKNVYQIPVNNLWEKFNTYIYTRVPGREDCSSRFILECMYYGKDVIYDIDYYDHALEVRKKDKLNNTVLTKDDEFLKLLMNKLILEK